MNVTGNSSGVTGAVACPTVAPCNQPPVYRSVEYHDSRYDIYLFFKPALINNYSLETFQNYFNYAVVGIRFPEKSSPITDAVFTAELIRNVLFTEYENNKLRGEISVPIENIDILSKNSECKIVDSAIPAYCHKLEAYNKLVKIRFDFKVSTN